MNMKTSVLITFLGAALIGCNAQCQRPPNWQPLNVSARADATKVILYVKFLFKSNIKNEAYGETYTVNVEVMCVLKHLSLIAIPNQISIPNMGASPANCPNRTMALDENYIIFLNSVSFDNYNLNEVNQEAAVFVDGTDTWKLDEDPKIPIKDSMLKNQEVPWFSFFTGCYGLKRIGQQCYIFSDYYHACFSDNNCPIKPDNWKPMEPVDRASGAEIVVKAKVKMIHYWGSQGNDNRYNAELQLLCDLKLPADLDTVGATFNVSGYGANSGICFEHHVTEGSEYILFLQRHFMIFPLPGATIPPGTPSVYGPQEVNYQEAVIDFTDDVAEDFAKYMTDAKCAASAVLSWRFFASFLAFAVVLHHQL